MDYTENADTVFALNQRFVKAGSDIMCYENPAYKSLDFHYTRWSVNHQEAYSAKGVNNNLAESFNARMHDLMRGTHQIINMPYTMQIKLHSFQITAVNQMGNCLKMSSNVVYGFCHLKNRLVIGREIIVKVGF